MEYCTQCNVELTHENAYKRKRNRKEFQSFCRKCFNDACVQRWIDRKIKAINYKGGKCCNCGYNKYYGALEFHHEDDNKEASWGKIKLWNWEKVLVELDKCVLLCANCHREEHHALLAQRKEQTVSTRPVGSSNLS